MGPTAGIDERAREIARVVSHLVEWADYLAGKAPPPPERPARLTFYGSASASSSTPVGDDR
jgi:hypothetical protein